SGASCWHRAGSIPTIAVAIPAFVGIAHVQAARAEVAVEQVAWACAAVRHRPVVVAIHDALEFELVRAFRHRAPPIQTWATPCRRVPSAPSSRAPRNAQR